MDKIIIFLYYKPSGPQCLLHTAPTAHHTVQTFLKFYKTGSLSSICPKHCLRILWEIRSRFQHRFSTGQWNEMQQARVIEWLIYAKYFRIFCKSTRHKDSTFTQQGAQRAIGRAWWIQMHNADAEVNDRTQLTKSVSRCVHRQFLSH